MQKDAVSTQGATTSKKAASERMWKGKSKLGDYVEEGKEPETRVEEKPSQNNLVNELRKKEEDKHEQKKEKKKERLKRKNEENQCRGFGIASPKISNKSYLRKNQMI